MDSSKLIAHHNISKRGLEVARNIGGLPMPSIAISKVAHPLTDFGDISLVAPPSMVSPGRNVSVWASDAYTGRQPHGVFEFRNPVEAERNMRRDPDIGHLLLNHLATEGLDDFDRSNELIKMAHYANLHRMGDPKDFRNLRDFAYLAYKHPEFNWEDAGKMPGLSHYGDIVHKLHPVERFTPSGNRKKLLDYTMQAIMKHMNANKAYQQGAEGVYYGPSAFRANVAPRFKSLSEIQKSRDLIKPKSEIKGVNDEFSKRYEDVTGGIDQPAYNIIQAALGHRGAVPQDDEQKVLALAKSVRGMPTQYFEAKRKDFVPLSSFNAAIVPRGYDQSMQALENEGVQKIIPYGSEEERRNIMGSMNDLHFKRGGAVQPSDAQKLAGNYKKDHISFQGLPISIETRKGQLRTGPGWQVRVPYDYGYIKRTEGADGDHVDVCIGPDHQSQNVFIVDQKDHNTGRFDEHKVMLGYRTKSEAEQAYIAGFSDGKGRARMGKVLPMPMHLFKLWLRHGNTKKPIDRALEVASVYSGKHDRDAG